MHGKGSRAPKVVPVPPCAAGGENAVLVLELQGSSLFAGAASPPGQGGPADAHSAAAESPVGPAPSGPCEPSSSATEAQAEAECVLSSRRAGSGLAARCCCCLSSE